LKHDYGLAPLGVRGPAKVQLHADLVMLARLGQALSRARAVPLAALYPRCLIRAGALLSVLVVLAWGIDVLTQPSDPQIGLTYVFSTLYAVLALVAIWVTVGLIARRRRRRRNIGGWWGITPPP
jgi:hypothetical protein